MVKIGSGHDPLLRRPFSVFEVLATADGAPIGITLLNKRIGPSTSLIYAARPGQIVACLGPLGRPFTLVDAPHEAWMVAGGVGLAPFATLAEVAARAPGDVRRSSTARDAATSCSTSISSRRSGVELVLTTEDGSAGERGRVIAPLERRLAGAGPPGAAPSCSTPAAPKACWRPPRATAAQIRLPVRGVGRTHHGMRHSAAATAASCPCAATTGSSITCDRAWPDRCWPPIRFGGS